jgi:hypothetical protein
MRASAARILELSEARSTWRGRKAWSGLLPGLFDMIASVLAISKRFFKKKAEMECF